MTNNVNLNNAPVAKRRKSSASLDKKKARAGWIFILPFLIGFVFVYFPILFDSIKLSFVRMEYGAIRFVGLENYADAILVDADFVQVLIEGLTQMIFDIPAILIFSLFMAVLLNQKMAGRAFFRAILFVPVIISTGLMEEINALDINSSQMEGGVDTGAGTGENELVSAMDLDWLFGNMKVGTELVEYVSYMINNIFNIVNRSGVQMLIFLSGLQSISPAIYESCQIDGASAWETFWKITFPMISPMILVNAVYTIIDAFTMNSNTVMKFISDYQLKGDMHPLYIGSAMAWIYFLIVILIVAAFAGIFGMFVFYQRRND